MISWWFTVDPASRDGLGRATMAINGLSWPHTERIALTQGDSVRWRVINLTEVDHPMHLHGFYFRVDSKGNGVTDSIYTLPSVSNGRDGGRESVPDVVAGLAADASGQLDLSLPLRDATCRTYAALDTDKGFDDVDDVSITCPTARTRCSVSCWASASRRRARRRRRHGGGAARFVSDSREA